MKREGLGNGNSIETMKREGSVNGEQSRAGPKLGDVTWIKLRGASWWPAQVVDEKTVSSSLKPNKKRSGDVLVRLYGTYEYSYMDPNRSLSEFDNLLKRHKGSHREIIQKGLKQDFHEPKGGRSKAKAATTEPNGVKKKMKLDCESQESAPQISGESARRVKVMQDLGLTAPSGSPFLKNGQTLIYQAVLQLRNQAV